jgi:hypothetical protein
VKAHVLTYAALFLFAAFVVSLATGSLDQSLNGVGW